MASTLEFRILGPLEVVGVSPVFVRARKQRVLLATLLLHANRMVSTDELIERLWEGSDPVDGRAALQVHVARLRRVLELGGGDAAEVIRTRPEGYLIDVPPECLDLSRFHELSAQARQARRRSDLVEELALLTEALSLWRGPVLADIPSDSLHRDEIPQLTEQWLSAMERRFALELGLGGHDSVIGEIRAASRAHPLRETLWCQLMLALYRSGRQAEALQAYRTISHTLREELGVDVGEQLADIHQAILRGSPELITGGPSARELQGTELVASPAVLAPSWRTLCQLPADVGDFVGRTDLIEQLTAIIVPDSPGTSVPIVALSGPPGVGKSALAVRLAHLLRARFPDGQWYVRMEGTWENRHDPADVLAELLRASGVAPATIPESIEARAAMFRARLTDRRVLLVLDNVVDVDQVVPLLPGTPGSAVLITCRAAMLNLVALYGAQSVTLGLLSEAEAFSLINRMLGERRVERERRAVSELTRLCGHLPLALRIAAANLVNRSQYRIRDYVAELRRGNRLVKLAIGKERQIEVRAAFDLSYTALSPTARRLFRLLGIAPGTDFTPEIAAVLASDDADAELDELASANVIEAYAPDRFRFHELLRLYAADRARTEDSEEERAWAVGQLLSWYVSTAHAAMRMHRPGLIQLPLPAIIGDAPKRTFNSDRDALAWLDAERANLISAIEYAADHGPPQLSWCLADVLRGYFWSGRFYSEWLAAARAGERAALTERDRAGLNAMRFSLGLAYSCLGNHPNARVHLRRALDGFRETGDTHYEVAVLGETGMLAAATGQMDDALDMLVRSHSTAKRLGLRHAEARTLRNLGTIHHALGHLDTALEHLVRALEIDQQLGVRHSEPENLRKLGLVYCDLGKLNQAQNRLTKALAVSMEVGARDEQAACHCGLAMVHQRSGPHALAIAHGQRALAVAREISDPVAEATSLNVLAGAHQATGNPSIAGDYYQQALRLCRELNVQPVEIDVLIGLARTHLDLGHVDDALSYGRRAVGEARRCGLRLLEGMAEAVLASTHLNLGDRGAALACAERALAIQIETDHQAELPFTRGLLERLRCANGRIDVSP